MGEEKKEEGKEAVSRRKYLGAVGGLAAAAVVGWGVAGYLASKPPAPAIEKTVTETKTITVTPAVTPTGFDWSKVGKQFSGETVTILVESGTRMDKWLDIIRHDWRNLTGINIEIVSLAFSQMGEAAMTDFLAGTGAYDIVYMVNFWGGLMAIGDHFYPIEDLIKEYPDLHDPSFVPENFVEKHMDLVAYWDVKKKVNGRPGKLTLMSCFPDGQHFFYRKDLFNDPNEKKEFEAQYGHELTVPKTWKEVHEIAEFFTRPKQGIYGIVFDGTLDDAASDFWVRFLTEGGQIWKYADGKWPPDNFTPNLDSKEAVQALEYLVEEIKWAPPGVLGYGQVEASDAFITKDIAQASFWFAYGGKSMDPKVSKIVDKVGFAVNPGKRPGRGILGGWGAGVSRYSKHKPAAFLTIEYLLSEEVNKKQVLEGYMSPARAKLYHDPDITGTRPYVPIQLATLEASESHHINFTTVSFELLTHIVEEGTACLSGAKDPETAANAIQERWITSLKREGYKVD
ncbi:extracellular solute-binding protein [Candidatus Bathyarchaeota archaeon]|nr:extracellular solute-binding protein [Candidatus Bathyarchaeota archaeon]